MEAPVKCVSILTTILEEWLNDRNGCHTQPISPHFIKDQSRITQAKMHKTLPLWLWTWRAHQFIGGLEIESFVSVLQRGWTCPKCCHCISQHQSQTGTKCQTVSNGQVLKATLLFSQRSSSRVDGRWQPKPIIKIILANLENPSDATCIGATFNAK